MGRMIFVAVAVVTLLLLGVGSALAAAPKFHKADSSVNDAGSLVVSFDERGLGNENIDYTLTADVEVTYACINKGGKHPQATNKETFFDTVTAGASFEAKNGRVVASMVAGPPGPGDFSCPPGQNLELANVSYTNIVLTDTTNGVSVSVDDASRVFIEL